jgi:hypothetical protein
MCVKLHIVINALLALSNTIDRTFRMCSTYTQKCTHISLLSPFVSAILKNASTSCCDGRITPKKYTRIMLLQLTDTLLHSMDKGELSGILLVDFRKAFDLINHELLLQKLAIYGLKDATLQWFRSYLTERK